MGLGSPGGWWPPSSSLRRAVCRARWLALWPVWQSPGSAGLGLSEMLGWRGWVLSREERSRLGGPRLGQRDLGPGGTGLKGLAPRLRWRFACSWPGPRRGSRPIWFAAAERRGGSLGAGTTARLGRPRFPGGFVRGRSSSPRRTATPFGRWARHTKRTAQVDEAW